MRSRNSAEVRSSSCRLAPRAPAWRSPLQRRRRRAAATSARRSLNIIAAENRRPASPRRRSRRSSDPSSRATAALRRRREHAAGQARERQALQPDRARPGELGEEQALAAEQRRLDLADILDLEVHVWRHAPPGSRCRRAASGRPAARACTTRAAGVHEGQAVAVEPLHDEAFAAEEADAELLLEVRCPATRRAPRTGRHPSGRSACRRAVRRSIGMILPGYGAANATRCLLRGAGWCRPW